MPILTLQSLLRVRHYGAAALIPEVYRPIRDQLAPFTCRPKPEGGLWTSPVGVSNGWDRWLADQGVNPARDVPSFDLDVVVGTRVLVIDGLDDLELLRWTASRSGVTVPQWYPLFNDPFCGVEAVHLTDRGQQETDLPLTAPRHLWGWDVETVLIGSLSCVREVGSSVPSEGLLASIS